MATLQELLDEGTLQLYQTITVANTSGSADIVDPVTVQELAGTAITIAHTAFLPNFIPVTFNPRVTPVIIFG